eukprot:m.102116 g.102116  ORF g.102116 m.102116 type:complete len:812 (+) comp8813_c0_seq3:148-2583(+)
MSHSSSKRSLPRQAVEDEAAGLHGPKVWLQVGLPRDALPGQQVRAVDVHAGRRQRRHGRGQADRKVLARTRQAGQMVAAERHGCRTWGHGGAHGVDSHGVDARELLQVGCGRLRRQLRCREARRLPQQHRPEQLVVDVALKALVLARWRVQRQAIQIPHRRQTSLLQGRRLGAGLGLGDREHLQPVHRLHTDAVLLVAVAIALLLVLRRGRQAAKLRALAHERNLRVLEGAAIWVIGRGCQLGSRCHVQRVQLIERGQVIAGVVLVEQALLAWLQHRLRERKRLTAAGRDEERRANKVEWGSFVAINTPDEDELLDLEVKFHRVLLGVRTDTHVLGAQALPVFRLPAGPQAVQLADLVCRRRRAAGRGAERGRGGTQARVGRHHAPACNGQGRRPAALLQHGELRDGHVGRRATGAGRLHRGDRGKVRVGLAAGSLVGHRVVLAEHGHAVRAGHGQRGRRAAGHRRHVLVIVVGLGPGAERVDHRHAGRAEPAGVLGRGDRRGVGVLGVVQKVVGLEVPQVLAAGRRLEDAQEHVDGRLLLHVGEGVAVVALDGVEDVARVRRPGRRLAVRLDAVDQRRAAILQRDRVAVVLVQLLEQAARVRVKGQVRGRRRGNNAQRVQLVAEGVQAQHELRGVGAVQAVDAVDADNSRLVAQPHAVGRVRHAAGAVLGARVHAGVQLRPGVEEPDVLHERGGDLLEAVQHVAALGLLALGHVPRQQSQPLAIRHKLVQVAHHGFEFVEEDRLAWLLFLLLDEIEHDDRRAVRVQQPLEVERGRRVERVARRDRDWRLGLHRRELLGPEAGHRPAHLQV